MKQQGRLTQKQTVTEHLVQSMHLLQMNAPELEEYLRKQALENPVIEWEEPASQPLLRRETRFGRGPATEGPEDDDRENAWRDTRLTEENLAEYLMLQAELDRRPPRERRTVLHIIQSLDDSGYYTEDPAETAALLNVSEDTVETCLAYVQQLDPAGVGARDLKECLLLQLRREDHPSRVTEEIISRYLPDVAENRLQQIARQLKCPLEQVIAAVERIRGMNPRPGSAFGGGEAPVYVRPDVVVEIGDKGPEARADRRSLPRLTLNEEYLKMLDDADDPEVADYLRQKIAQAKALAVEVAQRGATPQRVAQAMAARQETFFRQGKGHRSPMGLSDLATDTGLHPSTVSRALKGKYLQCRWGLFPMNYFLTASIPAQAEDGEAVTQERVQEMIRAIVDGEDKSDPLSDEAICEKLAASGVTVARRTVSKYRQSMGIPGRPGRRRYGN